MNGAESAEVPLRNYSLIHSLLYCICDCLSSHLCGYGLVRAPWLKQ